MVGVEVEAARAAAAALGRAADLNAAGMILVRQRGTGDTHHDAVATISCSTRTTSEIDVAAKDVIGNGDTEMTSQGTGGIEVVVGTSIETRDGRTGDRTGGDPARAVRMMRGTEIGIGTDVIVTGGSFEHTLVVVMKSITERCKSIRMPTIRRAVQFKVRKNVVIWTLFVQQLRNCYNILA